MNYVTGNELKALFEQGIPIVIEVSPKTVTYDGKLYENGLYAYHEFSPGMRATLRGIKKYDDDLLTIVLDMSNWSEYNKQFDLPDHHENGRDDLRWHETEAYPENHIAEALVGCRETIYDFHLVPPDDKIQQLYREFSDSGHINYLKWLEEQVIRLENQVSQLEDEADHLAAQ
jgi:hypothetical protein